VKVDNKHPSSEDEGRYFRTTNLPPPAAAVAKYIPRR